MVYHTDGNLDTIVTKQIVSFSDIYWSNTWINVDPVAGLNSRYILQWCVIRRISITEILHINETDIQMFWSHISKSWLYVCFMYYSYVRDINLNSSRKWSASHIRKAYTSVWVYTPFLNDDKSGLGLQGLFYLYGSEIWGKRHVLCKFVSLLSISVTLINICTLSRQKVSLLTIDVD